MFAFIPFELKLRYPLGGVPWANWLLIAINVGFFLCDWLFSWQWTCGRGTSLASILLYGFSHAGFWHLAANMWCLIVFGDAVNRRIGNRYYLLAYLGSVVLIGIVAWLMMSGRVLGASGGVFAVIGIALLLLPAAKLRLGYVVVFPITIIAALLRRPVHPWQWAIRWGDFLVPMLWCLVLIPLLEIVNFAFSGWSWTHLGHLLGLALGVLAVLLLPERISMRQPAPAV
jgi:membrane associated rhomboid family serine protease